MSERQREIEAVLGLGRPQRGRIWWALAAVLALGGLGAWYLAQRSAGAGIAYATQAVVRGDLVVTVTATGSVEPTNMVDISSELSGTLKEVLVDFNDRVETGQVLARLDTANLEAKVAVQRANLRAADARVARAQATLNEVETNFDTSRQLDERGVTSRQSLDTARAALDRARADLEIAEADVALSSANLRLAETELAKACICSPITGVVLDRQADAGQIVAASLSAPVLFTVAEDLTRMELQVAVDEADIGRLEIGDAATFTVDAYDTRTFPAEIARIRYAPQTAEGVVTYLATLDVDNSHLALRPGMTATAEIVVSKVGDALLVPNAALRFRPAVTAAEEEEGGGSGLLGLIMPRRPSLPDAPRAADAVWVLRAGQPVEVAIDPGDSDGQLTEIRSGGLTEGDLVIIGQDG